MSIVIIGGNECMERKYCELCAKYGCKAKVFCKYQGKMRDRIGNPDLMIVFTHTASHKMVRCALDNVCEDTRVIRTHTSSMASLQQILQGVGA